MPFWWRRRNKPWMGQRWKRRRRYQPRRRRPYKRRRPYRPARRRRRRRRHQRKYKVRKKRKQITIKQWQPESINKCKIKGLCLLVLGADGRQSRCYTINKYETVPPKTPAGGGFGIEQYSLNHLYNEYKSRNNIWTASNKYKDLCRYTGCKFTVYRHQTQDFIVQYDIQPPFTQTKYTNMLAHPYMLLQQKHHKIIYSKLTKTNGRLSRTLKIKPPKNSQNKWFFQKEYSSQPLVVITAAALNLNYSYLQCCNENLQLNIKYLNISMYQWGNWGNAASAYKPFLTAFQKKTFYCKDATGKSYTFELDATDYPKSVSYTTGYFAPPLLKAAAIYSDQQYSTLLQAYIPVNYCIYNPALDTGVGNKIFLHSITSEAYRIPQDEGLYIYNVPLWLGLFGFLDWLKQHIKESSWDFYCLALQSKALLVAPQHGASETIIPLDNSFIQGNIYFNQPPLPTNKTRWYPTLRMQLQTINDIVETGPYIPKLTNEKLSTWELKGRYTFYFKWGGPQVTDPTVNDPAKQGFTTNTSTLKETIQVCNPEKQKTEQIIHEWDLRRGFIKQSAIKRMCDNLSTSTDLSKTPESSPQKKKKKLISCLQTQEEKDKEMQSCLLSLCEKDTFQETQDLQLLIYNQHQQQQKLKQNIYKLLKDLKHNQNLLQLHTGVIS
nr:MAG: ORF1 [Torque teno midi virus]